MSNGDNDDDIEYFIPLTDQRVFGAGIKKKGIAFVPASGDEFSTISSVREQTTIKTGPSAGDRYLSIVLDKDKNKDVESFNLAVKQHQNTVSIEQDDGCDSRAKETDSQTGSSLTTPTATETIATITTTSTTICPICGQTISDVNDQATPGGAVSSHHSSIAHQVCLEHSHPPSHLDRHHMGVRYLTGFGWDPDARKGLGLQQEGIRVPIKAKQKRDTAGLGIRGLNESGSDDGDGDGDGDGQPDHHQHRKAATGVRRNKSRLTATEDKVIKLNAKEVRKLEAQKKMKAEKLRQAFYGEDLSHYLGPDS